METHIQFHYFEGSNHSSPAGHDTGWRLMPYAVFTHNQNSRLLCETQEHEPCVAESHEAFLIPGGMPHRLKIIGKSPQQSTWCHVQYTAYQTVDLLSLYDTPLHWSGPAASTLRRHCLKLIRLAPQRTSNPLFIQAQMQAAGLSMLSTLLKAAPINTRQSKLTQQLATLEPVLQHIRIHLEQPLTLPSLAKVVHMSRSRFAELFAQTMSVAPMQYVKQLRLDRAQVLLLSTDLPVAEIGERSGYPDPFHFSRTFKDAAGISPRAFRERHKQNTREGATY